MIPFRQEPMRPRPDVSVFKISLSLSNYEGSTGDIESNRLIHKKVSLQVVGQGNGVSFFNSDTTGSV